MRACRDGGASESGIRVRVRIRIRIRGRVDARVRDVREDVFDGARDARPRARGVLRSSERGADVLEARAAAGRAAAAAFRYASAFARRGGGARPRGLRGSVNMGNTCFMASVVQALAATTVVVEYFLRENHRRRTSRRGTLLGVRVRRLPRARVRGGERRRRARGVRFALHVVEQRPIVRETGAARRARVFSALHLRRARPTSRARDFGRRRGETRRLGHYSLLGGAARERRGRRGDGTRTGGGGDGGVGRDCVFHRAFAGVLRSDVTCASCGASRTLLEPTVGVSLDIPASTSKTASLEACLRKISPDGGNPESRDAGVRRVFRRVGDVRKAHAFRASAARAQRAPETFRG